ncbi:hypothetical protein A2U01_0062978, partial [Trifolium medium]|nr:hypothetical protein [Trifolium medium]
MAELGVPPLTNGDVDSSAISGDQQR